MDSKFVETGDSAHSACLLAAPSQLRSPRELQNLQKENIGVPLFLDSICGVDRLLPRMEPIILNAWHGS
jgi:hypothetical protein